MGSFAGLLIAQDLDKSEFPQALMEYMEFNVLSAITFMAGDDLRVIGVGFFWPRGRILQTADLIWFPWASKRNVLESYLNFANEIRNTTHPESGNKYVVLEFCREEGEKFFTQMCRYGVMRRVGTSHEVHPNEKTCVYETRSG